MQVRDGPARAADLADIQLLVVFHNLGIEWACSLLGFIAAILMPIPFL